MKILITGAKGQLGQEFVKRLEKEEKNFLALPRDKLDVSNLKQVLQVFEEYKPAVVINCSAYNLVDRAEEEKETAYKTNAIGPRNLAFACEKYKAFLVHYSTDYVFDGKKEALYTEEDIPNPLSEYAKSKYLGEVFVKEETDRYLLFRVSWVYGEGKQNFIYKLLQWAKEREVLQIAFNEISVPTYTGFIVEKTLKALDKGLQGLYHLVPRGYASRYEWAKLTFKLLRMNKILIPVPKEFFNLPARRPDFSAMSCNKIEKELGEEFAEWDEIYERKFVKRGNL
ncbi:MAG: dTDP-4-dehydrorhamnose reductase [Thermodesulfobacterium sp.]|nr:dTDP-4-dehydrorhamnose reductase [Thermodesulfobacterium sp.]